MKKEIVYIIITFIPTITLLYSILWYIRIITLKEDILSEGYSFHKIFVQESISYDLKINTVKTNNIMMMLMIMMMVMMMVMIIIIMIIIAVTQSIRFCMEVDIDNF